MGKGRDGNPRNMNNWVLVCSACGTEFDDKEVISLTDGHFFDEHPDVEGVHLNTVWRGKGPAPKKFPGPQRRPRRR